MADFEKMYYELFNGISDIIEELKALQQKAEESYIEAKEEKQLKLPSENITRQYFFLGRKLYEFFPAFLNLCRMIQQTAIIAFSKNFF